MTAADIETSTVAAPLAERLADPQVAGALATLLDHADLLAVLVEGLDQFVGRSEVIGDSLISGIQELRGPDGPSADAAVDLAAVAGAGMQMASILPKAAPGMVEAVESGAVDKLFATAIVSAEALPQVNVLARAFVAGSEEFDRSPLEVGGPVSLVRLLRDPDINRALSYFATVAKAVGRELAHPTT
jgi:hypothetical protein